MSATSAACHSRAAASHWALPLGPDWRAVRAMCVAQPAAWRALEALEALEPTDPLEAFRADQPLERELRGRQDGALT